MLRMMTAGESHGSALMCIIDGFPAGLTVDTAAVDTTLRRRQAGAGRGGRMKIEDDRVEFIAGLCGGVTTGAPIGFLIKNKEYENWQGVAENRTLIPRPGHADLAGCLKYGFTDARNVAERASARETAARTAAGAVAAQLLSQLGITVTGEPVELAGQIYDEKTAVAVAEQALKEGETYGGKLRVTAAGLRAGFGSYAQYDRRADAVLAAAVMSVPGIKSVSFGLGEAYAALPGSKAHDGIRLNGGELTRPTNNAGGIEGGVTNGEPLIINAVMKPIPSHRKPLQSVDLARGQNADGAIQERGDAFAIEACAVVAESVTAFALLGLILESLGGDTLRQVTERYNEL